jgi:hypothetical protein
MRDQLPVLQLQCCTTVNVFNVRYLNQVAQWITEQGFDFVYWNIMHDAWYFSISRLPADTKKEIASHLGMCDIPMVYRPDFERIINFMNNGESMDGEETRSQIRLLDQRRNQDLSRDHSELAHILNYAKT